MIKFFVNNEVDIEDEEYIINYNELNKLNITVIGGNTPWVKKMKEVLPNWNFITSEQRTLSLEFIKNSSLNLLTSS